MSKKPTVTTLASGFNSTETLNTNFEALRDGFDNTLSLDGSTPNAMEADLDLNGNNIIGAAGLLINGTDYLADVTAAKAAALVAQVAAETAETNAESSETAAGLSATAAAGSETASELAKTAAELAETNAETAESSASASATSATSSASTASTGASTATTKASEAATSATNAATSATESETAKDAAETARDAALAALDNFDDRYLGAKANAPTVDNDGNALIVGALYFNTGTDKLYIWNGTAWQVTTSGAAAGDLISTNNLSDVTSAPTSRTNLGLVTVASTGSYSDLTGTPTLGTAAATASTDYATAAQGVLAGSALQNISGESIENLSDVASMTPSDGQALVYGSGVWSAADMAGGIAYTLHTANVTMAANEGVIADTSGGAFTVTLPASPTTGDTVIIADGADWATTNLTVGRNGSTIEGDAADMTMDIGRVAVQFTYDGTTWQIYTQLGANSGNGVVEGSSPTFGTVTATDFAGDGSTLTGVPSKQDVNTLWLEVAQNRASFINTIDGVSDSYGDSTGVDRTDSTAISFVSGGIVRSVAGVVVSPINMTSNTVPAPYVASSSSGATTVYKLFDGTTSYEVTPLNGWTKIDLGGTAFVGSYSITPGVNSTTYSWKSWTFQGSNDDSTWTTLDTRTNFTSWPATGTPEVFTCTAGIYRYLRWAPTADGGAGAYAQRLQAISGTPAGSTYTVISEPFTADAVPTTSVIGVQATGANTLNTDLIVYASRDDGTTWTAGTLSEVYTVSGGVKYYETAEIDISGQPSGTAMRYKVYADNTYVTEINATIFKWG